MVSFSPSLPSPGFYFLDGKIADLLARVDFLGTMNFGKTAYRDKSGFEIDSQALVFKIQIPVTKSNGNSGDNRDLR